MTNEQMAKILEEEWDKLFKLLSEVVDQTLDARVKLGQAIKKLGQTLIDDTCSLGHECTSNCRKEGCECDDHICSRTPKSELTDNQLAHEKGANPFNIN